LMWRRERNARDASWFFVDSRWRRWAGQPSGLAQSLRRLNADDRGARNPFGFIFGCREPRRSLPAAKRFQAGGKRDVSHGEAKSHENELAVAILTRDRKSSMPTHPSASVLWAKVSSDRPQGVGRKSAVRDSRAAKVGARPPDVMTAPSPP
jgi:hypothetical protein